MLFRKKNTFSIDIMRLIYLLKNLRRKPFTAILSRDILQYVPGFYSHIHPFYNRINVHHVNAV